MGLPKNVQPFVQLSWPVRRQARLGVQIGFGEKQCVKRTPEAARRSRCGVLIRGFPAQPRAVSMWSSERRSTTFNRVRGPRSGGSAPVPEDAAGRAASKQDMAMTLVTVPSPG